MPANIMLLQQRHADAFDEAERLLFHFDFCPYLELKRLLTDASKSGRRRFETLFCDYYTMNTAGLTDEFRDRYFEMLFDGDLFVGGRPKYSELLEELSKIKRRKGDYAVPFSFVSKLIAIRDDRQPIYDRHVCGLFKADAPSASVDKPKRIAWFVEFLDHVRDSYEAWSVDPRIAVVLARLRERDGQLAECSVVRQIDFLVWKIGNQKLLGDSK